ncbi:MAG: DUF3325 family protein [Comamonas sp.]
MNTLLAALCLLAGWTLLYLASERARDASGQAAPHPAICRIAAALLALAAFALCCATQGAGMGSLVWLALLSASAFAVVGLATWAPQALLRLGRRQRK